MYSILQLSSGRWYFHRLINSVAVKPLFIALYIWIVLSAALSRSNEMRQRVRERTDNENNKHPSRCCFACARTLRFAAR